MTRRPSLGPPAPHRRRHPTGVVRCNLGTFYPRFDYIILLTAPAAVIIARLATRSTNTYGKRPEEIARTLALQQTIEPLLRRAAGHEIDTTMPLDQVVARVLQLVGLPT